MNSVLKAGIPVILLSVALLGCQKQDDKSAPATQTAEQAAAMQNKPVDQVTRDASQNPNMIRANYACDNGKTIVAIYDNNNPKQSRLTLSIDGKEYYLTQAISGSGARYTTEQGLNPEQGLEWHSKGAEAVASTITLDHTAKPEDEKILFSCKEQSS